MKRKRNGLRSAAMALLPVMLVACAGCGSGPAPQGGDIHINEEWTRPLPPEDPVPPEGSIPPVLVVAGVEVSFAFVENPVPLDRSAHVKMTVVNHSASPIWFTNEQPYVQVIADLHTVYLDFNTMKDLEGNVHYLTSGVTVKSPMPAWVVKPVPPGAKMEGIYEIDLRPGKVTPGAWDFYGVVGYTAEPELFKNLKADRIAIWKVRGRTADFTWQQSVK